MNVLDTFNLKGQVAVLTGGAGLFGTQITEALAEAGAKTFIASRSLGRLAAQAAAFRERGMDVSALPLDQARPESVQELLEKVIAVAGTVDVLVNNAVLRPMKNWSAPIEDFTRSMQVNATGAFLMTRTFGDFMATRGRGSIINIASIQGVVGPDFDLYEGLGLDTPPDYFFHKGGMLQLTRFAASKLGPRGVRVNTISPGGFYVDQPEKFVERYNSRTFLRRMANSTDLKGAVVFLASNASAYVTGTNLLVDGGYTAK